MEDQKQQQEQGQKPPTTCASTDPFGRAQWNLAACGAMAHQGRHLTDRQLTHLVMGVLAARDTAAAVTWLEHEARCLAVELQGELPGTELFGAGRRHMRLLRFVEAVRRG